MDLVVMQIGAGIEPDRVFALIEGRMGVGQILLVLTYLD